MLQNITYFPSKNNIAKYQPFIAQFWSDHVMLLDRFKLFGPPLKTDFGS